MKRCWLTVLLAGLVISGCSDEEGLMPKEEEITDTDLALLRERTVLFGHQSVGADVVQGLIDLAEAGGKTSLKVTALGDSTPPPHPFFGEFTIGENLKPKLKCSDFSRRLRAFPIERRALALMKFCYLDVSAETDVDQLFRCYEATIDSLRQERPNVVFVHVTVPLMTPTPGWRVFLKTLLGRQDARTEDNLQRNRFNQRMKERFAGEPVFDLAGIEATRPDGTLETFDRDGEEYLALAPVYSSDGGHLNKEGRMHIARGLLQLLAGVGQMATEPRPPAGEGK